MFKWLSVALSSKVVFVPIQISVAVLLVTAHIATFAFFIYGLLFFYNQYHNFLDFVKSMSNQNDLLSISFNVLSAMGFFDAFNSVFHIFSPFIVAWLVYKTSLIVFSSLKHTSDEVFKIGVLVGQ